MGDPELGPLCLFGWAICYHSKSKSLRFKLLFGNDRDFQVKKTVQLDLPLKNLHQNTKYWAVRHGVEEPPGRSGVRTRQPCGGTELPWPQKRNMYMFVHGVLTLNRWISRYSVLHEPLCR